MNFPPDHPLSERVRGICMAYPEAVEVISHGRCTFRAGKRHGYGQLIGPDERARASRWDDGKLVESTP